MASRILRLCASGPGILIPHLELCPYIVAFRSIQNSHSGIKPSYWDFAYSARHAALCKIVFNFCLLHFFPRFFVYSFILFANYLVVLNIYWRKFERKTKKNASRLLDSVSHYLRFQSLTRKRRSEFSNTLIIAVFFFSFCDCVCKRIASAVFQKVWRTRAKEKIWVKPASRDSFPSLLRSSLHSSPVAQQRM